MKIISWDVGIKNLAYCYLDIETNINIINWNLINLLKEKKCFYDKCKKKPLFYFNYNNKNEIYLCEKHKKLYETMSNINNSYNKNKLILKKFTQETCKTIKIEILKLELIKQLDLIILPILLKNNINYIIIENQPSYKNPKMKAISDTLYSWFLIRGINDFKCIEKLNYQSPFDKNKIFKNINTTYNYNENKINSINITNKLLNDDKWKDYFNNHKKKDDLADSFLQVIVFLKKIKFQFSS